MNAAFIKTVIQLASKALDLLPNYDQRQIKKLKKLEQEYFHEVSLANRDDQRVSRLYMELHNELKSISAKISKPKI